MTKWKIGKQVSILLVAITAIATVALVVNAIWSERPIVTLSLGSVDNPPSVLLPEGDNYYVNIWFTNAGKSASDFYAVVTATNAQVSFDKTSWGAQSSVRMILTPNSPTQESKKIFIRPQNGTNTLSLTLSHQESILNLIQEVRLVNISILTYNKTFSSWQMISYR